MTIFAPMSKTILLTPSQIRQRITRLAWQLYEDNADEKEVVIVGIMSSGNSVALQVADALKAIAPFQVQTGTLRIDKHSQVAGKCDLSLSTQDLEGKVVVIVDDVLNSGKTLMYALKPFLAIDLRKIRIVVLVDRNHRKYPIAADYSGMTLATTLKEHISVEAIEGELTAFIE